MEGKEEGEPRLLLEVRDISGMAGFYEQIQRADRLAAVGTLATGIAHEIRNPLASIRGMVQLLSEAGEPDESSDTGEYSKRILKEIDRLEKLIDSIMTFASSDDTPPESLNLNELLREVEMTARMRAGDKAEQIEVVWELDDSMPKAKLQTEKLRQAFLNLLVNAYQHCAKTGLSPIRIETVYLSVNSLRPIIVCISNPGEPIEEESRERLLEPFYTTKAEGTGLGLPIAYQMFLSNDGVMELECEDGEIQFWVRLPREAATGRASRLMPRLETPMPKSATPGFETS
jgi:nitrogen-specific signal transduction histidine kinase